MANNREEINSLELEKAQLAALADAVEKERKKQATQVAAVHFNFFTKATPTKQTSLTGEQVNIAHNEFMKRIEDEFNNQREERQWIPDLYDLQFDDAAGKKNLPKIIIDVAKDPTTHDVNVTIQKDNKPDSVKIPTHDKWVDFFNKNAELHEKLNTLLAGSAIRGANFKIYPENNNTHVSFKVKNIINGETTDLTPDEVATFTPIVTLAIKDFLADFDKGSSPCIYTHPKDDDSLLQESINTIKRGIQPMPQAEPERDMKALFSDITHSFYEGIERLKIKGQQYIVEPLIDLGHTFADITKDITHNLIDDTQGDIDTAKYKSGYQTFETLLNRQSGRHKRKQDRQFENQTNESIQLKEKHIAQWERLLALHTYVEGNQPTSSESFKTERMNLANTQNMEFQQLIQKQKEFHEIQIRELDVLHSTQRFYLEGKIRRLSNTPATLEKIQKLQKLNLKLNMLEMKHDFDDILLKHNQANQINIVAQEQQLELMKAELTLLQKHHDQLERHIKNIGTANPEAAKVLNTIASDLSALIQDKSNLIITKSNELILNKKSQTDSFKNETGKHQQALSSITRARIAIFTEQQNAAQRNYSEINETIHTLETNEKSGMELLAAEHVKSTQPLQDNIHALETDIAELKNSVGVSTNAFEMTPLNPEETYNQLYALEKEHLEKSTEMENLKLKYQLGILSIELDSKERQLAYLQESNDKINEDLEEIMNAYVDPQEKLLQKNTIESYTFINTEVQKNIPTLTKRIHDLKTDILKSELKLLTLEDKKERSANELSISHKNRLDSLHNSLISVNKLSDFMNDKNSSSAILTEKTEVPTHNIQMEPLVKSTPITKPSPTSTLATKFKDQVGAFWQYSQHMLGRHDVISEIHKIFSEIEANQRLRAKGDEPTTQAVNNTLKLGLLSEKYQYIDPRNDTNPLNIAQRQAKTACFIRNLDNSSDKSKILQSIYVVLCNHINELAPDANDEAQQRAALYAIEMQCINPVNNKSANFIKIKGIILDAVQTCLDSNTLQNKKQLLATLVEQAGTLDQSIINGLKASADEVSSAFIAIKLKENEIDAFITYGESHPISESAIAAKEAELDKLKLAYNLLFTRPLENDSYESIREPERAPFTHDDKAHINNIIKYGIPGITLQQYKKAYAEIQEKSLDQINEDFNTATKSDITSDSTLEQARLEQLKQKIRLDRIHGRTVKPN